MQWPGTPHRRDCQDFELYDFCQIKYSYTVYCVHVRWGQLMQMLHAWRWSLWTPTESLQTFNRWKLEQNYLLQWSLYLSLNETDSFLHLSVYVTLPPSAVVDRRAKIFLSSQFKISCTTLKLLCNNLQAVQTFFLCCSLRKAELSPPRYLWEARFLIAAIDLTTLSDPTVLFCGIKCSLQRQVTLLHNVAHIHT